MNFKRTTLTRASSTLEGSKGTPHMSITRKRPSGSLETASSMTSGKAVCYVPKISKITISQRSWLIMHSEFFNSTPILLSELLSKFILGLYFHREPHFGRVSASRSGVRHKMMLQQRQRRIQLAFQTWVVYAQPHHAITPNSCRLFGGHHCLFLSWHRLT